MKTAAILVVYSQAFAETAIQLFQVIIRRIDPDAVLIVVNNNADLALAPQDGVVSIRGTNILQEFGAWQAGIDYVRGLPDYGNVDAVVLANDTFCHYRAMGALEQGAFVRAVRRTARSRRATACGELSLPPGARSFSFLGVRFDRWIATYLFALNRPALETLAWQIHPGLAEVEKWAPCGPTEDTFFSPQMDPDLRHRFCAWLFGRGDLPRWRRWGPLRSDNHLAMKGKAHALVCEQALTARLRLRGARIRSAFHDPLVYLMRRYLQRI